MCCRFMNSIFGGNIPNSAVLYPRKLASRCVHLIERYGSIQRKTNGSFCKTANVATKVEKEFYAFVSLNNPGIYNSCNA